MRHIKLFEDFDTDFDMNNKPEVFVFIIHSGEGQELEAEVRNEDGKSIYTIEQKILDDGIMQHINDISGLREYLIDKKKINQQDILSIGNTTTEEMQVTTGHNISQLTIPTGI